MIDIIHNGRQPSTGRLGLVTKAEEKRDLFKKWKRSSNSNLKKFGNKYFKLFQNEVSRTLVDANERKNIEIEEFKIQKNN